MRATGGNRASQSSACAKTKYAHRDYVHASPPLSHQADGQSILASSQLEAVLVYGTVAILPNPKITCETPPSRSVTRTSRAALSHAQEGSSQAFHISAACRQAAARALNFVSQIHVYGVAPSCPCVLDIRGYRCYTRLNLDR